LLSTTPERINRVIYKGVGQKCEDSVKKLYES
jgi:hypothetical protein